MISEIPFALQCTKMVSLNNDSDTKISYVLTKVASYMHKKHKSNYIVYNLFRDRLLDGAANLFHQITDYPFPKASMVEGISDIQRLCFSTPPPTLR